MGAVCILARVHLAWHEFNLDGLGTSEFTHLIHFYECAEHQEKFLSCIMRRFRKITHEHNEAIFKRILIFLEATSFEIQSRLTLTKWQII